jgi:hypothetical protein
MTTINTELGIEQLLGETAADQAALTSEFLNLYWEKPTKKDIICPIDHGGVFVFDGAHWRKLDLQLL